ncbi:hypothetical protein [Methanobrevibacter sp. V14]|uniref:hypothetical protein n=1 Tax=Methanobrevibacter sp. V14 TaxID=3064280 RepID=UPI0027331F15|nr:hypothetical protein [Methanobrevibacter sp. V14]
MDEYEESYKIQIKKENELKLQKREKERIRKEKLKKQKEKEEKLKKEREEQERRKKQEQERLRKEAEIRARKLKIENERLQKQRQEKQRQIDSLIAEVKLFNNKSFSEMVSLEEEYSKIYDEILKDYQVLSQYREIALFKDYYSHLKDIKQIIVIENEIKSKDNLLNQFGDDLRNNGFLNYSKKKRLSTDSNHFMN